MSLPFNINRLKELWYVRVLYKQVYNNIDVNNGVVPVKRAVTIGDFKTCSGNSVIFELGRGRGKLVFDRQIIDFDTFQRAFRSAVDKLPSQLQQECGAQGAPATHATQEWGREAVHAACAN